ncbi:MAG: hypothetical protein KGJ06_04910, partial [Pseudomonadota bacterium]|nr:hypothetical protein [Pseudomonadota bacterium]
KQLAAEVLLTFKKENPSDWRMATRIPALHEKLDATIEAIAYYGAFIKDPSVLPDTKKAAWKKICDTENTNDLEYLDLEDQLSELYRKIYAARPLEYIDRITQETRDTLLCMVEQRLQAAPPPPELN